MSISSPTLNHHSLATISSELAQSAITNFFKSQFEKKSEKEQKQLAKAQADGNADKVAELTDKIGDIQAKFTAETWLANASNKMAQQLKFGTHISKGVHPDAKGDNVSFAPTTHLPKQILGSHSIQVDYLDANGNAGALPLASFFDFPLDDTTKIKDLILQDNPDFIQSLATHLAGDNALADSYHQAFKSALLAHIDTPITHERNKQTLWAMNPYTAEEADELQYATIVPLYPSVLTHEVYQKINHLRYSEASKTARDNRFKEDKKGLIEQKAYVTMSDIATVQLGGTKPQNVSMLMSKQGGRNYLLPSLPPQINKQYGFKLSKFSQNIFEQNALTYHARHAIEDIFAVIKHHKNNVSIRDQRKEALDALLNVIFGIAHNIRSELPAGWSVDYQLDLPQKYWLDPKRAELEGEEDFAQARADTDWHTQIIHDFANWLNALLKAEFPEQKSDFATAEHHEWEREIEDMKDKYQRAGKGVFL